MSASFARLPEPGAARSVSASRRDWLARSAAAAAVLAFGFGRTGPTWAATPHGPADDLIFDAESMPELLRALGATPVTDGQVRLVLPTSADNGAVVPVSAESRLPETTEMLLVVDVNPNPVALRLGFAPGTEPYLATRIRMAETGTVYAIVRAGGRLHVAEQRVDVTVGGCA
jgi:sulfur-oxidizing protein SoxY